jgi:hypothetical protein
MSQRNRSTAASGARPLIVAPFPRLLLLALIAGALMLVPVPGLAAPGPLRVLHVGQVGTPSARHAHALMRELGREAIWPWVTPSHPRSLSISRPSSPPCAS